MGRKRTRAGGAVDAVPASQVLPVNRRLCSFSPGCLARLLVAITEDGAIGGPDVRLDSVL